MESIFSYIDYRKYLKEYYRFEKETKSYFSYRYFSQKAGIKSPVFLKEIYDGKKNLSKKMIEKFTAVLKFSPKEATYFRNLVHFNQATTSQEKQQYYTILKEMVQTVEQHILNDKLLTFYENWYTSVIRELITQSDYDGNETRLAQVVFPPITQQEARESIELLIKLGLIRHEADGRYVQTKKDVTSGSVVVSHLIRNHNQTMLDLAKRSIEEVSVDKRYCKGITLGINRACYDLIIAETEAFKDRVIGIVNNCKDPDEVYELYLQLFPLSKKNNWEDSDNETTV